MTNDQVFAAFANREAAKGGSVRSVDTGKGVVLYSYSTPIAIFPSNFQVPVFTQRKFSVTTSKQQSQARRRFASVHSIPAEDFVTSAKLIGADFGYAR